MISVIGGAINTNELKQILKSTYEKDKKDIGDKKSISNHQDYVQKFIQTKKQVKMLLLIEELIIFMTC